MVNLRGRLSELLLTLPSFIWLILFFVIPTIVICTLAFKPHDIYGTILEGWTFENIEQLLTPQSLVLIWRTFWVSAIATCITVALAVPVGFYLSRLKKKWQNILLLAIVLPFWTSFLIRVFAWKALLHPEGTFKKLLVFLHFVSPDTTLLYNPGAVIFVMIYSFLPFAILPIYAASSKFDFSLYEAAMDLGASKGQAFFRIFVPAISKGIVNALLIVLIPIIGAYVIPDVVGGSQSEMIGNRIGQKVMVARNLPLASAWSMLLAVLILIPLLSGFLLHARSKRLSAEMRNME